MDETKRLINSKATGVINRLGWEWDYKYNTVRGITDEFTVSFSRNRKMLRIYVRDNNSDAESISVLPAESTVKEIIRELQEKLIPRMKQKANEI